MMTDYRRLADEGKRLFQAGQFQQSIAAFRNAVDAYPTIAEGHYNLGIALARSNDAISAAESLHHALKLKPDYVEALYELGRLFLQVGRFQDAAGYLEKVARLVPDNPQAHYSQGIAIAPYDIEGAVDCFKRALKLKPDFLAARTALLMAINYMSDYDAAAIYREHQLFSRYHEKTHACHSVVPEKGQETPDIIRIGYVSADLREHPVGCFMEPVLENHDRARFEISVFFNYPTEDHVSYRMQQHVDHWHRIAGMTDEQVKSLIEERPIDILIDLSGHTVGNRLTLFSDRSAPTQATWIGGPATTGLRSVDYFISDKIADPSDQQPFFSEKIVHLPDGFSCYRPPDSAPDTMTAPALKNGYVTFGSLHSLNKINHRVIDLWSSVLKMVPGSRLLIFRNTLNGDTRKKLQQEFIERGISIDHLDFRGEEVVADDSNYLRVYNEIDILLDTFPWSGHTTACESLWMGVPVVTLRSDRHAGRTVASILHQVGSPHLIADTVEQYYDIIGRLAGDTDSLNELRLSLRDKMKHSSLCDGKQLTRNLEAFFIGAYSKEHSHA